MSSPDVILHMDVVCSIMLLNMKSNIPSKGDLASNVLHNNMG